MLQRMPRRQEPDAGAYEVTFELSRRLDPDLQDVEEFLIHVFGRIHSVPDPESDDRHAVGTLKGAVVRIADMLEAGEDPVDICDVEADLVTAFTAIWDADESEFKERLELGFGDLLILDQVQIVNEHRGRDAGLRAAWQFLNIFRGGCAAAVTYPFPLDHTLNRNTPAAKAGQKKLQQHWGRLGFKRIPKTDTFFIDFARWTKALSDL